MARRTDSPAPLSRCADTLALALANAHPRDAHVTFSEADHTYHVDGRRVKKSVTGLLKVVDPDEFDAVAVSNKLFTAEKPNAKYVKADGSRMTPEEIRAQWTEANVLGTALHGAIERHLNGLPVIVPAGDANAQPWAQFLAWLDSVADTYEPYRTEWVIYDEAADVAGSIDAVLRVKGTDTFVIMDWKRCGTDGSDFDRAFAGKTLLWPANDLPRCKLAKWRLQVAVYRAILERHYGLTIVGMGMVVLHPDNDAAKVYWHEPCPCAAVLLDMQEKK